MPPGTAGGTLARPAVPVAVDGTMMTIADTSANMAV